MNDVAQVIEEEETVVTPAPSPEEVQGAIDAANGNEVSTEESNPDEDIWGTFAQDLESDDDEEPPKELEVDEEEPTPQEPVAPVVEEETPPVTPPAEEPNVIETPVVPVAEVATPQQDTPAPVAPPVVETPQQPPMSQEEIIQHKKEARASVVENLANHYSMSDEDATTLLTDPGAIMPKLRAEIFMDVYDATVGAITKAIPSLVQNMNTEATARDEAEKGFYDANPLLNKEQHGATVNRLAQAYINAVPNATPEQMVKEVGVQAMFLLGIDPTKVVAPAQNTPPATSPVQPYTPAGAGHVNTPSKVDDGNPWGKIADELLEDD